MRGVVVKKLESKENCETYGDEASLLMVKSLDIKTISPANSIAPQISCFQFICALANQCALTTDYFYLLYLSPFLLTPTLFPSDNMAI